MAIVILQTLPNVGREGFDQLIEELQKQGPLPADGNLFHASGAVGPDWRVVDVWESRKHFDDFQEARQRAAMKAAGDMRTLVDEFPIDFMFAADGWPDAS